MQKNPPLPEKVVTWKLIVLDALGEYNANTVIVDSGLKSPESSAIDSFVQESAKATLLVKKIEKQEKRIAELESKIQKENG